MARWDWLLPQTCSTGYPRKSPSWCPREQAVWSLGPRPSQWAPPRAEARIHKAPSHPISPSGMLFPSQRVLSFPYPRHGPVPVPRAALLPSHRAVVGLGVTSEMATAVEPQNLEILACILFHCDGFRTFLPLPSLWLLHTHPKSLTSLRPLLAKDTLKGDKKWGASLREANTAHRCSQNPPPPPTQPHRASKRGLLATSPSPCLPMKIDLSRVPPNGCRWHVTGSLLSCVLWCSWEKMSPRPGRSLRQTVPNPTEGVRSMRKGIRMPPESQPKGQGRKEADRLGSQKHCPPRPTEPCARHTVSSPERAMLVELGSNPRSSPELLCELWAGEFTFLSSSVK